MRRPGRCKKASRSSAYPTIGDFLAYQFITDINYSEITHFNEMDFVVPVPAHDAGECFVDPGGLNEPELIRLRLIFRSGSSSGWAQLPIIVGAAATTDRLSDCFVKSTNMRVSLTTHRRAYRWTLIKQKFEPILTPIESFTRRNGS